MLDGVRGSLKFRAVLGGLGLCGALVLVQVAFAAGDVRPVISGDPIVGHVLISSPSPTSQALYQWQSCDPAVANCSDSLEHNDSDWTDLTDQSHTGLAYTIQASDFGHFIRALIHDNNLGDQWATSVPVGPVTYGNAPPIAPEHGISFLVKPTGGSVKVKKPGQADFTSLEGLKKIPVESVIDTREGTVQVTAATGNLGDTTEDQSVHFWDGLIRVRQGAAHNAAANAKLVEKLNCPKSTAAAAKAQKSGGPVATTSRRRHKRVWGSGSGNYSTSGSGGTGSVRGTTWLTKDTCRGTFFKVIDGIGISVFDFDLNQQFELGPGQSYFARNR
jgi:hypothetical protein